MRRPLLGLAVLVVVVVAAGIALTILAERQRAAAVPPSPPDHGTARTFGGSTGFDVAVSDVRVDAAGRVALSVSFHNSSSSQQRADPLDFSLRDASGATANPVFDASCPRWTRADLHPAGGAGQRPRDADARQVGPDFGPVPLCFTVDHPGGSTLVWNPDVGVFGAPVPIALH